MNYFIPPLLSSTPDPGLCLTRKRCLASNASLGPERRAERARCTPAPAPLESQMEQVIPLSQCSWFNKPVSTPYEVSGLKPFLELRFHQQNAQHSFELFSVPVPHCQGILFRGQKCGHATIKVRKSFTECIKIALQGSDSELRGHDIISLLYKQEWLMHSL